MSYTKLTKLIKIWYYITVVALIFLGIKFALPILLPFIIALTVAAILKSPIDYFERKLKIKRTTVSFILVSIVLLALVSFVFVIFYSIYDWLSEAVTYLPDLLPMLTDLTDKITNSFKILGESMPDSVKNMLGQLPSNLIESLTKWITDVLSSFAKGLPNGFVTVFVTIVSAYLITRDYKKLASFASNIAPRNIYINLIKAKHILSTKLIGMIKGYSIITALTFFELFIGLSIINVNHAAAIAAVTAVVDLLPILGIGIVLIPWATIEILFGNVLTGVGLLILYAVITVVHNIITPKIVANQIKLDALTVLVSMYIGYSVIGFWGLIIAPIITAVARDFIMNEKTEY